MRHREVLVKLYGKGRKWMIGDEKEVVCTRAAGKNATSHESPIICFFLCHYLYYIFYRIGTESSAFCCFIFESNNTIKMWENALRYAIIIEYFLWWNKLWLFICFGLFVSKEKLIFRIFALNALYRFHVIICTLARFDSVPSNGDDISIVLWSPFLYTLRSMRA